MSSQNPPKNLPQDRPGCRIDCHKCVHYHVTWQPTAPHSCRAMGFKSKYLPSLMVWRNSGQPCLYFQPKGDQAKCP